MKRDPSFPGACTSEMTFFVQASGERRVCNPFVQKAKGFLDSLLRDDNAHLGSGGEGTVVVDD